MCHVLCMTKKLPNQISKIRLTYTNKVKASERPRVTCSKDAYMLFRENWEDLSINLFEEFKILLLDRSNHCMGIVPLSKGGVTGLVVDPKLVFAAALTARACHIILGHNHPSGTLAASTGDQRLTEQLVMAGKYLELEVLDHIIITDEGFLSFDDMGYMSTPRLKL